MKSGSNSPRWGGQPLIIGGFWTALLAEGGWWDRIFAAVQQQADGAGHIDWGVHFVDSTTARAHHYAAGATPRIWSGRRSASALSTLEPFVMPRVTVVIPTYNRSHLLRESIQSVLDQTYMDWSLLVADNDSSDDTADVVASFVDPRIRYHRHATNLGMRTNYQFALTAPDTELVAYLSDDDLYQPELLQTAIGALDRFEEAAYFACPAQFFGTEAAGELRPYAIRDAATPFLYVPASQAVRFLGIDNPGPMVVCRRRALHGRLFWGWPNYVPTDLLLLTQLMAQGGFVFGNRALMQFRVHEQNASYVLKDARKQLRLICMIWYGVRWLAQFLLERRLATLADIEAHGLHSPAVEHHVVPLVLALSSWDSPAMLRSVARRVFQARTDGDAITGRFRLARRLGFWTFPVTEKLSQLYSGWRP